MAQIIPLVIAGIGVAQTHVKAKADVEISKLDAEASRQQGEQDAIEKRKKLLETVASINAQAASSGVALTGQGSLEKSRTEARAEAQRQISTIRRNSAMGASSARMRQGQIRGAARAKSVGLLANAAGRTINRGSVKSEAVKSG